MKLDATLSKHITAGPDRRLIFAMEEHNKEYIVKNCNKKEACIIKIDGALISSKDVKKCDYGLCVEDNRFFLIELKGVDLSQACKQLLYTLDYMRQKYTNYEYFCRAVVTRMPSKKDKTGAPGNYPSSYKKLLQKLLNNEHLRCASRELHETI
ncbi:hypothetical protein [Treponema putidum]|uniref:hypothetical protein n=1 Tax=Treponema putidum TaxID=221027 RepID=UPI003D8BD13B